MELHIHLHHHYDDKLFTEIKSINVKQNKMGQEIDNLVQEVSETKTLQQSAITLIQGLKTRLDEAINNNDMGRVVALRDDLDASNTAFAEALAANTPAENGGGTGDGTGTGENGGTTTDPNAGL